MGTSEQDLELFQSYMADPAARAAFVEFKAKAAEDGTARRYEHVLRAVASRPWAIHEPMLAVIVDVLTFRAFGGRLTAEEIEGRIGAARRTQSTDAPRGVARIPVSGILIPKAGMMDQMSGGVSAEALGNTIKAAVNNPEVSSIVLDIDSPGGAVGGIPELADIVAQANQVKPVVAVANHEALSAAYWLASQAGSIIASPSARVGSIGVISRHEDQSGQQEQKGVKTTLVSAGRFKAEGSPFEPLSEEGRAHLQDMVNSFYGMFVEAVARGRGVSAADVRDGFGEGRVVMAKDAMAMGLIDGIDTIEGVIASELASVPRTTAVAFPEISITGVNAKWADEATITIGSATSVAKETHERLGDGTKQDDEIERLRLAVHADPEEPDEPEPIRATEFEAAVDNSTWDGNRAMGQCSSASDYRSICAGEHAVGTPDQRQHWALPHHYLGRGPNAAGVRAALSRISQTENWKAGSQARAQSHLDAHMNEINPGSEDRSPGSEVLDPEIAAMKEALDLLLLTE